MAAHLGHPSHTGNIILQAARSKNMTNMAILYLPVIKATPRMISQIPTTSANVTIESNG